MQCSICKGEAQLPRQELEPVDSTQIALALSPLDQQVSRNARSALAQGSQLQVLALYPVQWLASAVNGWVLAVPRSAQVATVADRGSLAWP